MHKSLEAECKRPCKNTLVDQTTACKKILMAPHG